MKYPIVITYRHTQDNGMELRHSLRSLKNITNFNGQVFIAGDIEPWLTNVYHIPVKHHRNGYIDQEYAMLEALHDERLEDDFIYSMDDLYITSRTRVVPWHQNVFNANIGHKGYHRNQKILTFVWLQRRGYTTLDYEVHAPMLINKHKRMEVNKIIMSSDNHMIMKPRSLYGNIFNIGGEYFADKKTRSKELPEGKIISTLKYTPELNDLFSEPSIYEK